jgi:L-seryl-tRNA(Ser) seleniumtransferase
MSDGRNADVLRSIPSVSALLGSLEVRQAAGSIVAEAVTYVVRDEQHRYRSALLAGADGDVQNLIEAIVARLSALQSPAPRVVINGTGVIVQTNLGRAPVSAATASAMADAASAYVALETELASGRRGGRGRAVSELMRLLTGAERTLVVNNNAAAVLLMLAALAFDREVVVSRGEAVEIGGGFRVPDVLRQSGARLVEVGTTNRTYERDFADAITDDTAALLRVHASNFEIVGFTASPSHADLAALARQRGVLLLEDAGSGCLLDTEPFGLAHEPTLAESLAAGVDIVCASGDKLLGGPQAGLILGKAELVEAIARHPLARAVRSDKATLAGIAATLQHYVRGEALREIPVWRSISMPLDDLERRVSSWASALGGLAHVEKTAALIGGGALPGQRLPSRALVLDAQRDVESLAESLRLSPMPVVSRIVGDKVAIDGRTVLPQQDDQLLATLRAAIG